MIPAVRAASRTPPGVRELKLEVLGLLRLEVSRTPPGVRELKLVLRWVMLVLIVSHPSRGA